MTSFGSCSIALVEPNNVFRGSLLFHILITCMAIICPGGGPLECQGGYQARPKIHVIRVVFQDQALYARTAFRGAKTCKIGKKGVFLVI